MLKMFVLKNHMLAAFSPVPARPCNPVAPVEPVNPAEPVFPVEPV